jgi:hypothetical protein
MYDPDEDPKSPLLDVSIGAPIESAAAASGNARLAVFPPAGG